MTVDTAYGQRRLQVDVGIGDGIGRARDVMLEALRRTQGVLAIPGPEVLVVELAGSGVTLRARWWIEPPRRIDAVQATDRALQALKEAPQGAGIDLPYPTTRVLFHDQTEETDGDRTRQREGWPAGPKGAPKARDLVGALRMGALRSRQGGTEGGA